MKPIDPQLDLTLERIIRAPRTTIWEAWTTPSLLQQWWVPSPTVARIDSFDVRPGGDFVSSMSDDGITFVPHTDGIFLVVEPESRLVFTNAIDSSWHPASPWKCSRSRILRNTSRASTAKSRTRPTQEEVLAQVVPEHRAARQVLRQAPKPCWPVDQLVTVATQSRYDLHSGT